MSSRLGAYNTVSVGTTAAVIASRRDSRNSIIVQNVHASQVLYVGTDSSVTTSNGLKVAAGESVKIDDYRGVVYGIASGAATDVRFLESYA